MRQKPLKQSLEIISYLSSRLKLQFLVSIILIICSAFIEMKIVTIIIPILSNQNQNITSSLLLSKLYYVPLLVIFKFSSTIYSTRLSFIAGSELSALTYIGSTSKKFILANDNWILTSLITFTRDLISGVFTPAVRLISSFITILILLFPYIKNLSFSNIFIVLLCAIFLTLFLIIVKRIAANNSKRIAYYAEETTSLAKSLSNVHLEYIVNGSPTSGMMLFFKSQKSYKLSEFKNEILTTVPRTILEIIVILFLVTAIIFGSPDLRIVILSFTVAFTRIYPLIQQTYFSYVMITGNFYNAEPILKLIKTLKPNLVKTIHERIYSDKKTNIFEILHADSSSPLNSSNRKYKYDLIDPFFSHNFNIKEYPYLNHLKDEFELTFNKGFNFIIGNSGAGKSSLIKIMLKDILYSSNRFHLAGAFYYSSQFPFLPPISVKDALLQYSKNSTELTNNQTKLFLKFGFKESDLNKKAINLSGGELKRICLLKAFFSSKSILLLDEPFTGLSADQIILLNTLLRENISNRIIIVITHFTETILKSDNVIDLNNLLKTKK